MHATFPQAAGSMAYHQLTLPGKISSILLLAAILASQYGVCLRYLECRVANYLTESSADCDCRKFLEASVPDSEPLIQSHVHADEWYYPSVGKSPAFSSWRHSKMVFYSTTPALCDPVVSLPDKPPISTPMQY